MIVFILSFLMLYIQDIHRSVWKHEILSWVSLCVGSGSVVWLVWPNGCWKTSILNIIQWYTHVCKWWISIEGNDISHLSVRERARLWMTRVFQYWWVFNELTIYENLALAYTFQLSWRRKILPVSWLPKHIKEEIKNILQEIDLWDVRYEYAWWLSWWQKRMVEIARVILQKPRIVLLDEPTSGVSWVYKKKIINFVKQLAASGAMVIVVEHDFLFLSECVDYLYVLDAWKLFAEWTYDKILSDNRVRKMYFG